jgi:methionyl-tRNA formyltransferase
MRIVYFANNRVGLDVLRWLSAREDVVAVVVHPSDRARLRAEIVAAAGLPPERVIDAPMLARPETVTALRDLKPDLGLSVFFGYILRPSLLEIFPSGCLNLHPGLLPYNRGTYPNVWSIVEGTPAGVTLHYVDAGVDTGDIVAQREVAVQPTDTGATLYARLEAACFETLVAAWPAITAGTATRRPQPAGQGTTHRRADVDRIDRIDLDRHYPARELIDILRARTFAPYRGAYFETAGRRVYVRVELFYEDELEGTAAERGGTT